MALAVVLLLLLPLAVVYGLGKAARARAALSVRPRSKVSQGARMLVLPAIVTITAGLALVHFGWIGGSEDFANSIGLAEPGAGTSLYTGNGLADLFLWIAFSFGNLMVFLFFVSIPYVVGSVIAVGLVVSGRGGGWARGDREIEAVGEDR